MLKQAAHTNEPLSQRLNRIFYGALSTAILCSAAVMTIITFVVLSPVAQALKSAANIV